MIMTKDMKKVFYVLTAMLSNDSPVRMCILIHASKSLDKHFYRLYFSRNETACIKGIAENQENSGDYGKCGRI